VLGRGLMRCERIGGDNDPCDAYGCCDVVSKAEMASAMGAGG
jgi:hypothetical protein